MLINEDDFKDENDIEYVKSKVSEHGQIFDYVKPGDPIRFNFISKTFELYDDDKNSVFIGWFLKYDKKTRLVYVLYKGFLSKDVVNIPISIKDLYVSSYVIKIYESFKNQIKNAMPRIKKLKRINLQMLNSEFALIIYDNFNNFLETYEQTFGTNLTSVLKASIVTTPIYINDKGTIKTYKFYKNELNDLDIESEGNFLSFFAFEFFNQYKNKNK